MGSPSFQTFHFNNQYLHQKLRKTFKFPKFPKKIFAPPYDGVIEFEGSVPTVLADIVDLVHGTVVTEVDKEVAKLEIAVFVLLETFWPSNEGHEGHEGYEGYESNERHESHEVTKLHYLVFGSRSQKGVLLIDHLVKSLVVINWIDHLHLSIQLLPILHSYQILGGLICESSIPLCCQSGVWWREETAG